MSDKNGGPAFPHDNIKWHTEKGMSLRDWYAGMAMQGLVSHYGCGTITNKELVSPSAFEIADAMIKERSK